jgi:hypothetical protein
MFEVMTMLSIIHHQVWKTISTYKKVRDPFLDEIYVHKSLHLKSAEFER